MNRHNPKNERIKRQYLAYLSNSRGRSPSTIDQVAAHIADYERFTKWRDFARFHIEQARRYREDLRERVHPTTGKPLAHSTVNSRLLGLRSFHIWLSDQAGYRRTVRRADADYFSDSGNHQRIARAKRPKRVTTLEQVLRVISHMPSTTEVERRDRAMVAFALVSGARDNAIASMRLGLVDIEAGTVNHDARYVRTKRGKTIFGPLFPVSEDALRIVLDWVCYLRDQRQFDRLDPLFPATEMVQNSDGFFEAKGVGRELWANADPVRRVFKAAFKAAGILYSNPHTIRVR